jgi:hypothetical protein
MNNEQTTEPSQPASREQLFWAREFTVLAREQAHKKGVPDHAMAQAMLVQAWMLFTGQSEDEARQSVSGLFTQAMAKRGPPPLPPT